MVVLQVCAYRADYPGNFIASLETLEKKLTEQGHQTIYAFDEKAFDKPWCQQICKRTKVYFLPEAHARILPKTYNIFRRIYTENTVDIVHSHFELYDIPATVTSSKSTRIFWHLHDPIRVDRSLRGLLWRIQYGIVSKRANLISVSDHYRNAVIDMGFPADQSTTILNSIDLRRISDCRGPSEKEYDFLTFGWDFHRKGDDLILNACKKLAEDGYHFRFLLNGNQKTWPELDTCLAGPDPDWLVRGEPVSDVNQVFSKSKLFIQASRRETFSYAVCEAAYAALPVISSDIAGLEWAHSLPSVKFFPSEDWMALYKTMKDFLEHSSISSDLLDKSRQIIADEYSLDAWAEKIIHQYGLSD